MPNMCPRYRQHMPKIYPIYPRYPQDMSNISPSYAQDMYKVCPRYAQDSPKICPNHAWDMPMICPRYAQDLTKSQKHHSVSNIDSRDTSGSKKIEDNDDDKLSVNTKKRGGFLDKWPLDEVGSLVGGGPKHTAKEMWGELMYCAWASCSVTQCALKLSLFWATSSRWVVGISQ